MGVRRNFSRGVTSKFCLSFSGCWQCNENGLSQNTLPFEPVSLCWLNLDSQSFVWKTSYTSAITNAFLFINFLISILRALSSPIATGRIWWACSPKQSTKPPNRNMKHYKPLEFLSNFNFTPPRHKRTKAPHTNVNPPQRRLSGDGSGTFYK